MDWGFPVGVTAPVIFIGVFAFFLDLPGHLVTWSPGHLVTWSLSLLPSGLLCYNYRTAIPALYMETLLSKALFSLLAFIGISEGGLFIVCLILSVIVLLWRITRHAINKNNDRIERIYNLVREVQLDHAATKDRVQMHADHFHILDADVERSKQAAFKAAILCHELIQDQHQKK